MSSPPLVAYTYDASPYGYKMLSVLSLYGLDHVTVPVSAVMPRPELTAIGVNYRRIPVLAAGKDIFCDSQAIIDYIASSSPSSSAAGDSSADYAFKLLGDNIFRTAFTCIPAQAFTPEFVEDRRPVFKSLTDPELQKGAYRSLGLAEVRSLFTRFQADALSKGKKFINGDKPTLADAHVAWSIRWVLTQIGVGQEPGFGKSDLPQLWTWLEAFIAATESKAKDVSGDEAAKLILRASGQVKLGAGIQQDFTGFKAGDRVAVNQTDGDPTHPTEGKLLLLDTHEVVVEVDSGVRVHLPRVGQRITKA